MRVLFAIVALLAVNLAFAQEAPYQAGKHFHEISPPVRTRTPKKIEVTEVFWYGCGHCFNFAPLMMEWEENKKPDDVAVVRSPAIWRDVMETHARIYYTAKALRMVDEIHMEVFEAMHKDGKRLARESEIAPLFTKHGVDQEKFTKTFNSFGVKSQVQQADARQRSYGVTGTPSVVVDGRYRISGADLSGGTEEMLRVVEFLVDRIRQEKQ